MFHLGCAGKLGNCPDVASARPRFTCLYCRWRRREYKNFIDPPFWITYTYKSIIQTHLVRGYMKNGLLFEARDGRPLKVTTYKTLKIDPRGHFTGLRCATIIVLDLVMTALHIHVKPLVELCEFMSCYPTF